MPHHNDLTGARILVTGGSGFFGTHVRDVLTERRYAFMAPARDAFDLLEQAHVRSLFRELRPHVVFHLAGRVGGIWINKERPAEFFYENLLMNTLVHHEAFKAGVRKFVTVIGGCSYPAQASSPIAEDRLWQGYPQPESAPYSLAKRMVVVGSEAYRRQYGFRTIVLLPGNMYGPHDNFNLDEAHVIPALVRKVWEAEQEHVPSFTVWGTGRPTRDFVYARDCAEALVLAAERYDSPELVNLSSGQEVSIRELVDLVVGLVGYEGDVTWDTSKPDGQLRKVFDVARMRQVLQFAPKTTLEDGLRQTIEWFAANLATARL